MLCEELVTAALRAPRILSIEGRLRILSFQFRLVCINYDCNRHQSFNSLKTLEHILKIWKFESTIWFLRLKRSEIVFFSYKTKVSHKKLLIIKKLAKLARQQKVVCVTCTLELRLLLVIETFSTNITFRLVAIEMAV